METKTNIDLSDLDELLEQPAPVNATSPDPNRLERLKALINRDRPAEVHPLDRDRDPAWVASVVSVFGNIAGHARMFRFDKQTGKERTFDEIRGLVANLCRQRGVDAVFEMLMNWRGFKPTHLPKEVQIEFARLFGLPDGFFSAGG